MKSKYLMILLVLCTVVIASCNTATDDTANKKAAPPINAKAPENGAVASTKVSASSVFSDKQKTEGNVTWLNVRELENAQKADKRKVMVDLYTDWCGWCKRMDKATFQHDKIAGILNDKFHAVKFDAEDGETIKFNGKDHVFVKAGRKGYNQLAHSFANGRMSYPTIAFLDEDLNRISSYPGYKAPGQFDALLAYIDGDHYKKGTSLGDFEKSFKSEIPASEGAPTRRTSKPRIKTVQKK